MSGYVARKGPLVFCKFFLKYSTKKLNCEINKKKLQNKKNDDYVSD